MKKRYTFILALTLAIAMTSCGSTNNDNSEKETEKAPAETTTAAAANDGGGLEGLMDDAPAETTTTTTAAPAETTTTTTAAPAETTTTTAAPAAGTLTDSGIYVLTKAIINGEENDASDFDQMIFIFKDDGTVEMVGKPDKLTRDGKTITDGTETLAYTITGDTMTMSQDGTSLIFTKTDKMPETTTKAVTAKPADTVTEPASTEKPKTETAQKSGDLGYAFWNGYSYYEDGQIRFKLETFKDLKLGFILHFWAREGDPEWHEEMITLTDLKEGAQEVDVGMILDNRNHDLTYQYKSFKILFGEDCAILEIERDESTLAGGTDSTIQSGTYVLTP